MEFNKIKNQFCRSALPQLKEKYGEEKVNFYMGNATLYCFDGYILEQQAQKEFEYYISHREMILEYLDGHAEITGFNKVFFIENGRLECAYYCSDKYVQSNKHLALCSGMPYVFFNSDNTVSSTSSSGSYFYIENEMPVKHGKLSSKYWHFGAKGCGAHQGLYGTIVSDVYLHSSASLENVINISNTLIANLWLSVEGKEHVFDYINNNFSQDECELMLRELELGKSLSSNWLSILKQAEFFNTIPHYTRLDLCRTLEINERTLENIPLYFATSKEIEWL
ncbi:hypothetical protein SAMN04488136_11699 [Vibrio xiamenensis]|uniref:Uncharacterized protein n=1 Tax=Vibrio xiamenensis TaxID=861298 RepID=A0A1G8CK17_9VIBR|nr:hypothetical protein [Vibrio xiamenensis]SDH45553.1 hypothetical protein SAMN04488136_11699 [Vibrio xiamenensis]